MAQCVLRYRGRDVGAEDVAFIRELIAQNPGLSRRRLSATLCRAWNWVQPNGALRDMVCRGLLLALHRAGHIQLPAPRMRPPNNVVAHRRTRAVAALDQRPLETTLAGLGPVDLRQVRRTEDEALFGHLLGRYHYLGYCRPVGEHLKYVAFAQERAVACLAWSSAPHHLGPRDRFIGWTPEQRQRRLHLIAYNTRFLIAPWVQVPLLASHLLSRVARVISQDWLALYHQPIHLLETFIDPQRFPGTCYRAANWRYLGRSTGRGHRTWSQRPNRSLKELWVYPLSRHFRQHLFGPDGQACA
jgi:hypothetical protein